MGAVTINAMRDAVNRVIDEHFPDAEIMGEEIKQGLREPCFFVKLIQGEQTQELGGRYHRSHAFDIHYFALDNREAHDVAEKLYEVLRLVELNGMLYQGTGMKHEIIDGVLHFFVDYNFNVREIIPEETKMQTIEQGGECKK